MEVQDYALKKEIIEQLQLSNKNFFTGSNLEFKIFQYTLFFAVYTFTIQIVFVIVQYFNGNGFLNFFQTISLNLGILGLVVVLILYFELNKLISRSSSSKNEYLRNYFCETCNFYSFSNVNSTFHAISNPNHLIKERTFLFRSTVKNLSNHTWDIFEILSMHLRKSKDNNVEDFGEIFTGSEERVRIEKESVGVRLLIFAILMPAGILLLYYIVSHISSLNLLSITPIVFSSFAALIIARFIAVQEAAEDDDIFVYLMVMRLTCRGIAKEPKMKFKLYMCGRVYWNNINKGKLGDPIDTPKGPLYLIENVIWNKFGELIGVNPDDSSRT